MAPPPPKLTKSQGDNVSEEASSNLWVGNLAPDVTDSDLMDVFAKYGALDSVTTYSSRSYAFVYFKRPEDAAAAKESLQGMVVHGSPLRIEFARPARPSRNLWVGGISPAVSKEQLEKEFMKFGEIEDFKFSKERNTALVGFSKLEDASRAMKEMNGKRIAGEQIRVDFLRSLPSRRDHLPDQSSVAQPGARRQQHSQPWGRKENPPSKTLWIGYPPAVRIDEQMLYNAMILFGEIERIKNYPARHFAFVEFRSVNEARQAKEGLQGHLFSDPRITIMYANSELAPGKDYSGFQTSQREIFDHHHPMGLNNFPGQFPPGGINRSNLPPRPFGPQGSIDSMHPGPEFTESLSPDSSWSRQSPPTSGILPSPASGIRPPFRATSRGWDVLEINQLQREAKRSRIEAPSSFDGDPFTARRTDDHGLVLDKPYGLGQTSDEGISGPFASMRGDIGPPGALATISRQVQDQYDEDYIWRGTIAKGGQPVCHARCVPIGKGIDFKLPDVVNCSARTGLDMLAQHFEEALGFDIVFFLPDSEDDFEPYTEFLRYLGLKNRAGVAKFDDGTTLFLVPPSDFLRNVLKFDGPARLYGVVLKRTQPTPSVLPTQPPLRSPIQFPQYVGGHHIPPSEVGYNAMPHKDDHVMPVDRDRVLHEDLKVPSKSFYPPANESVAFPAVPSPTFYPSTSKSSVPAISQDYASTSSLAAPQSRVSLTPELIATLATLLPANAQSSSSEMGQPAAGSSVVRPSLSSAGPDKGPQVWSQVSGTTNQLQLANQFSTRPEVQNQFQSFPSVSNIPSRSENVVPSIQTQDANINIPYQAAIPPRLLTSLPMPSPSGQFALPSDISQPHQLEPHSTLKDYGMVQGATLPGVYNPSIMQQPNHPSALSSQVQTPNYSHVQSETPVSASMGNWVPSNQGQQIQTSLPGSGQSTSESEVDKNQRYQSTLQFAANLLLQIQQQQQQHQQTSNPSTQGSGNPK